MTLTKVFDKTLEQMNGHHRIGRFENKSERADGFLGKVSGFFFVCERLKGSALCTG